MPLHPHDLESLEGFQNADSDDDWKTDDPVFKWTQEDLDEFIYDWKVAESERQSLIGWWEDEGVRCYTFDRDPNQNPYKAAPHAQRYPTTLF